MPATVAATLVPNTKEQTLDNNFNRHPAFGGNEVMREQHFGALGGNFTYNFVLTKAQINDLHNNGLRIDSAILKAGLAKRGIKEDIEQPDIAIGIKRVIFGVDPDSSPFVGGIGDMVIKDRNPDPGTKAVLFTFAAADLASTVKSSLFIPAPIAREKMWAAQKVGDPEYIIEATAAITGGGANSSVCVAITFEMLKMKGYIELP